MKKSATLCVVLAVLSVSVTEGAIAGSITPSTISPVQNPGETQTYAFDYRSSITPGSGKADILFLTDTTGTMGPYVSGIRNAFDDILSSIVDELPDVDIQYCVADYKDYYDFGNYAAYGVNVRQPFTSDAAAAKVGIDSMYAVGGIDIPESQLKAMVSLAGNWLTPSGDLGFNGRRDAQKIVVWAGDAEGHYSGEPGLGNIPPDYYPSLAEALSALNAQGIVTFGLNLASAAAGIDLDYGGDNQATYLTDGTGGGLVNSVGFTAAEVQEAVVDAVMTGVNVLSNITLSQEIDGYALVAGCSDHNRVVGSRGGSNGHFQRQITSPDEAGIVNFDLALLGNGAELDRVSVALTTVPEPCTLLLLGLGGAVLLRRRS